MKGRFAGYNILLVEDDPNKSLQIKSSLQKEGAAITACSNYEGAIKTASEAGSAYEVAIIDMYIPLTASSPDDRIMRGEELAMALVGIYPNIKIIGMSAYIPRAPFTPFRDLFAGFIEKDADYRRYNTALLEQIEGVLAGRRFGGPKSIIVHGHDEALIFELKNFVQNSLNFPAPLVLREQPSLGKTIIEKFEHLAGQIDLAFILLTPDDPGLTLGAEDLRRSRQNVIFEAGFLYGQMRRHSGAVILLHKGNIELPSDLSGVVWINIGGGIESAGESIRRELRALGWE